MIVRNVSDSDSTLQQSHAMLSSALKHEDGRFAGFLKDFGTTETLTELREGLVGKWGHADDKHTGRYTELNFQRIQGQASFVDLIEMALAAREESMRCVDDPGKRLEWLLNYSFCLGYLEALHFIESQRDQKRKAASRPKHDPLAQVLRDDVLAFIKNHQPPEGWSRTQAIQGYAALPWGEIDPRFRPIEIYDTYWANAADKINHMLSDKEFSEAFDALLKR